MTIFTILKNLITILIVLFGLTLTSFSQLKPTPEADAVKIVKFYPNPATTGINFELPSGLNQLYSIQIYNFMGRKVRETNATSQKVAFSLDGFYRGVYIFQLRDQYGKIVDSGKFQVAK
jgi:ABC-type dipeptide/oligopeptide/nickel transport system permease component